jgi:hypothetical protein
MYRLAAELRMAWRRYSGGTDVSAGYVKMPWRNYAIFLFKFFLL